MMSGDHAAAGGSAPPPSPNQQVDHVKLLNSVFQKEMTSKSLETVFEYFEQSFG